MNLIKVFTLFFSSFASGQMMGSQHDEHNCVTDGGYSWCESTSSCVRLWETPCPVAIPQTEICDNSPMQLCRMMCPEVNCESNECAMRQGSCCDYTCESTTNVLGSGNIPENCVTWFDGCNTCSVINGKVGACTLMMCFRQETPECRAYSTGH